MPLKSNVWTSCPLFRLRFAGVEDLKATKQMVLRENEITDVRHLPVDITRCKILIRPNNRQISKFTRQIPIDVTIIIIKLSKHFTFKDVYTYAIWENTSS